MPQTRLPELDALRVLLAVARTGSLNAAATEVGVTQQAVSARIRAMEALTGVRLVNRSPRGSELTPAGTVVAQWAARLLEVANELDTGLAALRADRRHRLRVAASLTIAEHLLPAWLVALRSDALRRGESPVDVELCATNSDVVSSLVRDGSVDLGFIEGPSAPRGLRSKAVGSDRLVLVVAPEHPWARRSRPVHPGELARTPLVCREAGSGTRDAFESALHAHLNREHLSRSLAEPAELAPAALVLSTTSAVRSAVLACAGPAVLSELAVGDDLATGRLREVKVGELDLRRTLRVIWIGDRTPPAGAARDLVAKAGGAAMVH